MERIEYFQRQESGHYYYSSVDDFSGTWEAFYFGQRAYIYSLLVRDGNFFKFLKLEQNYEQLFRHGVKFLYFDMLERTFKVLTRVLRDKADFVVEDTFQKDGRTFVMVRASRKRG